MFCAAASRRARVSGEAVIKTRSTSVRVPSARDAAWATMTALPALGALPEGAADQATQRVTVGTRSLGDRREAIETRGPGRTGLAQAVERGRPGRGRGFAMASRRSPRLRVPTVTRCVA